MASQNTVSDPHRYYWICLDGEWIAALWQKKNSSWRVVEKNQEFSFNEIEALGEPIPSESITQPIPNSGC